MKKRSILNSPRIEELKKKKRLKKKRKIIFFAICGLLVLLGLIFLLRIQKLRIENIEISGNKILDSKAIEEAVKEKLSRNYFYFLPKSNFLFYPKGQLKNELKI